MGRQGKTDGSPAGQPEQFHIALFISSLQMGGSERVLVNLAGYFQEKGHPVTLVTQYRASEEYPLPEGVRRVYSEISEEESGGRAGNFVRRFRRLRGIWKRERPDVILSFIGKNNLMAVLTSRFLRIPVAVSVRGEPSEEYYSGLLRLAARIVFRLADGIVLQTKRCREFFPKAIQKKSIILYNSLNPAFLRSRFEGEREKTIVAVGRVDANKNHEMLIRAFAAIADRYPDYRLVIYGNGDCRERLQELAGKLGLGGRVSLPGSVKGAAMLAERIRRASVYVLSSDTEGMPNTLLEAMALGLPVIATDCPCGGPAELIEPGVNGLLTPVRKVVDLTDNLQKILDNPSFSEEIGRNAAKVQDKYNPDLINKSWLDYLRGLCRI